MPQLPLFVEESLEKMVHSIFVPVFSGKRHTALLQEVAKSPPLDLSFVKDATPDIVLAYQSETSLTKTPSVQSQLCAEAQVVDEDSGLSVDARSLTVPEVSHLKTLFNKRIDDYHDEIAEQCLLSNVKFFSMEDARLIDKVQWHVKGGGL